MRVDVYYNLQKQCLSVRSREKHTYGKVIKHVNSIVLKDVEFVVSEAGRQRVIKSKQKNVHAYVRGTTTKLPKRYSIENVVKYNPYLYSSFVTLDGTPIKSSKMVFIDNKNILSYNNIA